MSDVSQSEQEQNQAEAPAQNEAPATGAMLSGVGTPMLQKKLADRRSELPAGGGGGGSESSIAESGFQGERSALPFQGEMEQGFGRSFGNVEAYSGREAQQANQSLGS